MFRLTRLCTVEVGARNVTWAFDKAFQSMELNLQEGYFVQSLERRQRETGGSDDPRRNRVYKRTTPGRVKWSVDDADVTTEILEARS